VKRSALNYTAQQLCICAAVVRNNEKPKDEQIFERNQEIKIFEMASFKVGNKVIVGIWDGKQQKNIPQEKNGPHEVSWGRCVNS
jgi:hypothetical protein